MTLAVPQPPCVAFSPPPYNLFLSFNDPDLESRYWINRIMNVLRFTDAITYGMGVVITPVLFFKIKCTLAVGLFLWTFTAACLVCLVRWFLTSATDYARRRTCQVLVLLIGLLLVITLVKLGLPPPTASISSVLVRVVLNSNLLVLVMNPFLLQLKFKDQILFQLVLLSIANQYCVPFCGAWFNKMDGVMVTLANRIKNAIWIISTASTSPLPVDFEDGTSACWRTLCFLQWTTVLFALALLYIMESHSRIVYFIAHKNRSAKECQLLWRMWRDGVLMSGWCFMVVSSMAYATLNTVF